MSLDSVYNSKLSLSAIPNPKSEPVKTSKATADDNDARAVFLSTILNKVSEYADLDQKIVAKNRKIFTSIEESNRRIYFNRFIFLMTYASAIEACLVQVDEFRDLFIDVVKQEIAIDGFTADKAKEIRKELYVPELKSESDKYYVYGRDRCTSDIYMGYTESFIQSYVNLGTGKDRLDKVVKEMPSSVRKQLGWAFSNYGYALRAIMLNDKFVSVVAHIVNAFYNG